MKKARLSEKAEGDLADIWEYIAEDNRAAARRTIGALVRQYKFISSHPLMGRSREDLQAGLRSFGVGNYLIFYRVIPEGIAVIRILHGARDLQSIFERGTFESYDEE